MLFRTTTISAIFYITGGIFFGCIDSKQFPDGGVDDSKTLDLGKICSNPNGDKDLDGITNGEEGCLSGRDTDGDGIPDWEDSDSDDDKIPDYIEKGEKDSLGKCKWATTGQTSWPCDTDGDGVPDYLDTDSDDDGLKDGDEDYNGDGFLGCCLAQCNAPGSTHQKMCKLTKEGCGFGQKCVSGLCMPVVSFECSDGETDPRKKDTFGDGKLDCKRGIFICRDSSELNPKGRKSVKIVSSPSTKGNWKLALEKTANYGEVAIANPGAKEIAAVIDEDATSVAVAGFVVSRDLSNERMQDELTMILQSIDKWVIGKSGIMYVMVSGTELRSHDWYKSIQGITLDVKLGGISDVSTVRNEFIGVLLGKSITDLSNIPGPYVEKNNSFIIRFTVTKRVEFKRDSKGKLVLDTSGLPQDSGDMSKWRLIIMGSVAVKSHYGSTNRRTSIVANDLSSGTALALVTDTLNNECDVAVLKTLPVADIIWVIDESLSMDDNRTNVANNAKYFFSRAVSSGLDFRMGVTGVNNPKGYWPKTVGKLCDTKDVLSQDDGGNDRFLLPSERTQFENCIINPPGLEAGLEYGITNAMEVVKRHLPRADNDATKIRKDAQLVIILATDEIPYEFKKPVPDYKVKFNVCTLDAKTKATVDTIVKPHIDLLSGVSNPEATAVFNVIGGVCQNSCDADVAHGYRELAQKLKGQVADVCQYDLNITLNTIIDNIVGEASPVKLERVPIAASLSMAMDEMEIQRSREKGFDYRAASNALVLLGISYKKGSQIMISYKRWERQTEIK